jgi:hypothetical protein
VTTDEHPKDHAVVAIMNAQDELDKALEALEAWPVVEVSQVRLVAHSLQNYLTVATAWVDLLEHALVAGPSGAVDRRVTEALAAPQARQRAYGLCHPVACQRRRRGRGALDLGGR